MNSQEEKLTVFFKTEYTVHGLTLQRNAILTFEYGGPHDVKVILRVPSAEEEKRGHKPSNPFCSASSCYQVTGGNVKVFRNIIANRIIDPALRLPRSPGIEYQTPERTYAKERASFRSGEIRVLDAAGHIESAIPFDETDRKL
jgi:hypothetical protein